MCCTLSLVFPIPLVITVVIRTRGQAFWPFGPWVSGLGIQHNSVELFLTTFCCHPSVDGDEVHFELLA